MATNSNSPQASETTPSNVLPDDAKAVFDHLQRALSENRVSLAEHQQNLTALNNLKGWANTFLLENQRLAEQLRSAATVEKA